MAFIFTEGPATKRFGGRFFLTTSLIIEFIKWMTITNEVTVAKKDGRPNPMDYFLVGRKIGSLLLMKNEFNFADPIKMLWGSAGKLRFVQEMERPMISGWCPKGGMYFTRSTLCTSLIGGTSRQRVSEQDGEHVYYLSGQTNLSFYRGPKTNKANGINRYPCGKTTWYRRSSEQKKLLKYEIRTMATINKELFCEMGSDGMTIDDRGNSTWLVMAVVPF